MDERRLTFRPARDATPDLPLGVRAVGHYKVDPTWNIHHHKNHYQLYWCIVGRGRFILNAKEHVLRKDQIFLYRPGDLHDMQATCPLWEFRFISFDGAAAGAMIDALGIESRVRNARKCPHSLFEQLHATTPSPAPEAERQAATIAYDILQRATLPPLKPQDATIEKIKSTIEKSYADPFFGIEQLAEQFKIHRSTLYRQFRNHFNITPSQYLARLRINTALAKLTDSEKSLAQIAEESGYRDLSYFGKVINAATGYTPGELRKLNSTR